MKQEIKTIFQPLHDAIMNCDMNASNVFDWLGGFTEGNPAVATALAYHMRDYLYEIGNPEITPWGIAVAEAYRRAFFDAEFAHRYGTQELLEQGEGKLKDLVNFMTHSLSSDSAVASSLFPAQVSTRGH